MIKQGTKDELKSGQYGVDNDLVKENNTDNASIFANLFGAYANGVVPVSGIAATGGMSSTDLAALGSDLMTAMPLFDTSKLTVDQKGNSRAGKTIMGAYVGN